MKTEMHKVILYALKDGRDSGRTLEAQLTVTMAEHCQAITMSQAVDPTGSRTLKD